MPPAKWSYRFLTSAVRYLDVARGWESKSVEAQQAEATQRFPASGKKINRSQTARLREKESVRLARERILRQIKTSRDPRHRGMLAMALAELEERLRKLE